MRGSVVARNAGPSRKPGSQQVEVVPRPGLIGHLDQRNQRLLTGPGSWPVNGHEQMDVIQIAGMTLYKIGIILFNIVPYIAILIVT